jgi:hypothetical protein
MKQIIFNKSENLIGGGWFACAVSVTSLIGGLAGGAMATAATCGVAVVGAVAVMAATGASVHYNCR